MTVPASQALATGFAARRLVTLDALGTLVELEDPYRRLADELAARGAPVEVAAARRTSVQSARSRASPSRSDAMSWCSR